MRKNAERKSLLGRAAARIRHEVHRARLRRSVKHLHGPAGAEGDTDGVVVVALVRNGMYYLEEFLSHYRALGAAQFVFCDNGSTDGTLERLRTEPDTVILQSLEAWGHVESEFRRYAAERYAKGRWCLFADMDEMFDFEGAGKIRLQGLTRYLRENGYTALMAQMLDLFPGASLDQVATLPYANAIKAFVFYEPGHLLRQDYYDPDIDFAYFLQQNDISTPEIKVYSGGVRRRVFDEMCCLTKHPLVHVTGDVIPGIHPHAAAHVRCADFTALIRHYKFANDPAGRDADAARRQAILHGDDLKRIGVYEKAPDLTLYSEDCRRYRGIAQLIDDGFLVASPAYSDFVAAQESKSRCPA